MQSFEKWFAQKLQIWSKYTFYIVSSFYVRAIVSEIFDDKYENVVPNPRRKRLISVFLEMSYLCVFWFANDEKETQIGVKFCENHEKHRNHGFFFKHDGKNGYWAINTYHFLVSDGFFFKNDGKKGNSIITVYLEVEVFLNTMESLLSAADEERSDAYCT